MNKVILTGYFYPPKNGLTPEGTKYLHFSLGLQKPLKNKEGKYDQQFVNCTVLSEYTMKTIRQFAQKGMRVGISGKIDIGEYENHPTLSILVDEFNFEESKKIFEMRTGNTGQSTAPTQIPGADNAFMPAGTGDEDLPFA